MNWVWFLCLVSGCVFYFVGKYIERNRWLTSLITFPIPERPDDYFKGQADLIFGLLEKHGYGNKKS